MRVAAIVPVMIFSLSAAVAQLPRTPPLMLRALPETLVGGRPLTLLLTRARTDAAVVPVTSTLSPAAAPVILPNTTAFAAKRSSAVALLQTRAVRTAQKIIVTAALSPTESAQVVVTIEPPSAVPVLPAPSVVGGESVPLLLSPNAPPDTETPVRLTCDFPRTVLPQTVLPAQGEESVLAGTWKTPVVSRKTVVVLSAVTNGITRTARLLLLPVRPAVAPEPAKEIRR